MLMHATVSRCVHFSGVVLYLWSQYVNFTFSSQTAANICTHIYKLFNILSQSVSQGDGHTVGHPQSQRWLAQRQARPRPASNSSSGSSSGPGQAGQLEHDRYCAAATVIHSTMNLSPSIHTCASDDDRSASSINANAHLMHIFRYLSLCVFLCAILDSFSCLAFRDVRAAVSVARPEARLRPRRSCSRSHSSRPRTQSRPLL